MKKPPGPSNRILLRKRANWRRLRSAASRAKADHLLLKHRMRLRRNGRFQKPILNRFLRSSASHNDGTKVRSPPPQDSESPETLSKRGKTRQVDETLTRNLSSPRVNNTVLDGRKEEETYVVGRRMTRAMDGEESRKLMMYKAMDAPRVMRFKALDGDKNRNLTRYKTMNRQRNIRYKAMDEARRRSRLTPTLPDHSRGKSISLAENLRQQERGTTESANGKSLPVGVDAPSPKNAIAVRRLTRLDMAKYELLHRSSNDASDFMDKQEDVVYEPLKQEHKKASQAGAVEMNSRPEKTLPPVSTPTGVITRGKAGVTAQAQPTSGVDGERLSSMFPKNKLSGKSVQSIEDAKVKDLHGVESGPGSPVFSPVRSAFKTVEGRLEEKPHSEKATRSNSKRGLEHDAGLHHVAVNVSAVPTKHTGVSTRKGKHCKERSSVHIIQGEVKGSLTRGKGILEEGQGRLKGYVGKTVNRQSGDIESTQATVGFEELLNHPEYKEKTPRKEGSYNSKLLKRRKRLRIINNLDDPRETNTNQGSLLPITTYDEDVKDRRFVEELTPKKVNKTFVRPRRSKRRRTMDSMDDLNGHEASQKALLSEPSFVKGAVVHPLDKRKGTLQEVVKNDNNTTAQDAHLLSFMGNDVETGKVASAPKVAEDGMESNMEAVKFDPGSKCCLVATNPTETGGRQMRPRPLDLEQPLLVLVEGQDQDYYEFDGGLFYRMLQQQPEPKNSLTDKVKSNSSSKGALEVVNGTGGKVKPILIPSFQCRTESEDRAALTYTLPDSYIKAIPKIQDGQAEYDMDEEDDEWLNKYNQTMSPSSALSADQFEKIVDLLENKAAETNGFNSITEALEEDQEHISEECCICNGGENSAYNLVLQCASCHIRVHQSCYGIHEHDIGAKEKNWYCRKCEAVAEGRENADISCALCCKQGGALKPATEPHKWAHVVCALYTNETYFVNTDAMEPIDGLNAADARAKRQRRQCWLCGMKEGSAERCSVPGCKTVFHVSCGVTQGASFELQHSNQQVISVRVYCPKHALIAFGAAGTRLEEGDKENRYDNFQKPFGHEEKLLPMAEKSQSHNHWTRRRGRKKSIRKGRTSELDVSGHDKGQFAQAEKLAEKVTGAEEAGAVLNIDDVHEIGHAAPDFVEGIYFYWISKRAKHGGALLHHIQQERAAKNFGIFNSVDAADHVASPISQENFLRHSEMDIDMMVVAARHQLQKLRELTHLVLQRERLKLNIYFLDQDILKVSLEALKNRDTSRMCFICKEKRLSLVCTVCNRSTCFYCFKSKRGSGSESWVASLKLPYFVCFDCQKQDYQTHTVSTCKSPALADCRSGCLAGSDKNCAVGKADGSQKMVKSALFSLQRKPCILLSRADSIHQDKLAIEAFWEQSHPKKTVLVSDLLKDMQETPLIDVPKLPKKHCNH